MLVGQVVRWGGDFQGGDAAEEGGEGDLQFRSGEVLAEALVDAVAEGDVVPVAAVDVEAFGLGKRRWVPVGRGQQGDDSLAGADAGAAEFGVLGGDAGGDEVGVLGLFPQGTTLRTFPSSARVR